MTRHRKACKIYQQYIDTGLIVAQYAQHAKSMAVRMASQANQQVTGVGEEAASQANQLYGVEEADTEQIQTDFTVSFAFVISSLLRGFLQVVAL